ncbi:Rieske (2Fe-2S) protein [Dactylosporangium sp. CA-139066]|uniref:Rieske (2Fe-2S) protein n=1 Tax=Dactylosporangium sp. CA-139066 TaxID=3239930 RepID=UPI003D8FA102
MVDGDGHLDGSLALRRTGYARPADLNLPGHVGNPDDLPLADEQLGALDAHGTIFPRHVSRRSSILTGTIAKRSITAASAGGHTPPALAGITPRSARHIAVAASRPVHGPPSEGNIVATNEDPAQPSAWCANRRVLLAAFGGAGAAAVLSACGSDATAQAPASAPSSAPASLADTAQVPVGGGIVTNGLLIVQPVSGSYKAYDAACPHKGILVAAPQNGIATCPAHASTFSITDGSRISGPTPTGLKEVKIRVDGTKILRDE